MQLRKKPIKIPVYAPFPGEFIDPENVGMSDRPNSILTLPEWPFFCNEILSPITGIYYVNTLDLNNYEFVYELPNHEGVSLRIYMQYELYYLDELKPVSTGEIVGNVNKEKAEEERRIVPICLEKENHVFSEYSLDKIPGKRVFKEGDIIGTITYYPV